MTTTHPASRVRRAMRLLRKALPWNRAHRPAKAARIEKARADLTPPPKPYPAIVAARAQSLSGEPMQTGMCLQAVRECYGIPAKEPSAAHAWAHAHRPHRGDTNPPRGFPVFWTGGSHNFGHVAISAGNGWVWSTDIKRPGFFNIVPLTLIREKWGLTYAGWTEDLNGVLIHHGKAVQP